MGNILGKLALASALASGLAWSSAATSSMAAAADSVLTIGMAADPVTLDPNLTRGVGGTGLGLYISRELVTRMNGRIWVVSDGRNGSSFFLELPIA